jgi:hypothetical protein
MKVKYKPVFQNLVMFLFSNFLQQKYTLVINQLLFKRITANGILFCIQYLENNSTTQWIHMFYHYYV